MRITNGMRRLTQIGAASVLLAVSSLAANAQANVCIVVPSSATYDATIAVASNFYSPAQDLIATYTSAGQPGAGQHIQICQNATADLDAQIRTGSSGFALFLAANSSTPTGLEFTTYVQSGAMAQLYATGIPVLFARYATVTDVKTLVPNVMSGVRATVSSNNLIGIPLSTANSQTVAVANPSVAPYGLAAFNIMNMPPPVTNTGMRLLHYPPLPSPYPSWLSTPYGNIDLTFQSVANSPYTNKSGFVSKAQICSGINGSPPTYIYVEFTGSNYLLQQKGILIASGNGTQDGIGVQIFNYMLSNPNPSFWPNFLSAHCYM